MIKKYLASALHLSENEFFRVSASWSLKLILHTITVLGFTLSLALFVGEFSVEKLLFLFIAQSLVSIVGTFALSSFLRKFSKRKTLILGAMSLLFCTTFAFTFSQILSPFFFFGILIIAYSVVIMQMNIVFALFVEDLFSPLESERAFPIIESAEPIGGILAGVIAGFGIHFFTAHFLVFLWGIFGVLIAPVLWIFLKKLEPIPKPHSREEHQEHLGILVEFEMSVKNIMHNPFLKILFWVVLLQWMAFNLVEFQYTSAAALEFSHGVAESSHGGSDAVANELAHGLGIIHIAIYGILLFFQILFASGIQRHLGIAKTLLLHPLFVFISTIVSTIHFSFATATLSKGVFEVFGGVARNAYHTSFYVLRPHIRSSAKEFLEGIARPMGMFLGSFSALLLQFFIDSHHHPEILAFAISTLLLFVIASRIMASVHLEEKYTMLARKNLETQGQTPEKFDAIEILAQKGHKNALTSLLKVLRMKNEKSEIKIQILKTLEELRETDAIPDIISCFSHTNKEIQMAAVEAMAGYKDLGEHFITQSFAKHRVIEALQKLFYETQSKKIKLAVIRVFQNIRHPEIIPFLLKAIESEDEDTVSGAIRVCGMFHDISVAHYIEKFLEHENPRLKADTIIALWQFVSYRLKLTVILGSMMNSSDKKTKENAIFAVGETKAIQEIPQLLKILQATEDMHLKKHICVALAKMEYEASVYEIVEMILHPDKEFSSSVHKLVFAPSVEKKIRKLIQHHLEQKISQKISALLMEEDNEILEEMSEKTLSALMDAYEILGEKKEAFQIAEILEKRRDGKFSEKPLPSPLVAYQHNEISLEDLLK